MKDINLVIGCGLSGAVAANLLANNNEKVLVIDKRKHIAGNIYDYRDKTTGITVHKYGPHVFHTNDKSVWDYLSKFTNWSLFYLKSNVMIEGNAVTLPFNLNTLYDCFSKQIAEKLENKLIMTYGYGKKIPIIELKNNDDVDLKFLSDYIYKNVFEQYTVKQWGIKPEEIDESVISRVPVSISFDNRYFQDKYQGIPEKGYTNLVNNLLNHKNIKVKLNTAYNKNLKNDFKRIICTASIDEFYNYEFGELPYRSLKFDIKNIDKEYFQKTAITNYPNDYDFTRITEHKYFLSELSKQTVISIEYPQKFINGKNERFYPIKNSETDSIYNKYLSLAEKDKNVYFIGRLGDYKYYNMDLAVKRAMDVVKSIL